MILIKTMIVLTVIVAVFTATAGAISDLKQYAFPASDVLAKQRDLRPYWPSIACKGIQPVVMRTGGKGYRFIYCVAELDNPPTIIWFRINSNGRIVREVSVRATRG